MYLDVQPLAAAPVPGAAGRWGWDVRLRDHRGTQLCDASAGFGTVHEATDLARFASVMLAERDPLDFHLDGSEPGWRVTASGPGGQRVAQSRPMSEFGAHHALRFIEDAATRSGERTLPLRVNSTCLCGPDDGCRHHTMPPVAYTGPEMPSEPDHYLTVAPDSDDAAWWQVVAREAWDDHPRVRSLQLPSRSDAESLAMFVSAVAAEPRSVVYDPPDGPKPSFRTDDHQDSVLVDVRQVLDGEGSVAGWQLRATTPDGSFAGPDGPTLPSLTAAHEALDFVKAAVSCFPAAWPPRPPMPRVEVHTACACGIEGWECRHYSNPPELAADPPPPDPARAVMVGIHVRPYSDDSRGWEVVTTDRDGSPWQLSGPYQTVEDATAAQDFMARVVNAHPQLHVLGWGRQWPESWDDTYTQPARDEAPTVGIVAAAADGPWHLQCRYPDGAVDATSPPYRTYRSADEALYQIGSLNAATANCMLGYRASVEAATDHCQCSMSGWRCEHLEDQRTVVTATPDRGGLSL